MEKIENLEDKIKTEMETLKTKLSTIEEELRVVSNLDKLRSDAAEKRRLLEAEHLSLGARKTASLQNANSVQVSDKVNNSFGAAFLSICIICSHLTKPN